MNSHHARPPVWQPPAINHKQISIFRAILLHGTMGRAAEVTGSSQPTLSRELARLEQVLGFALFDRLQGRLRPTVRGLAFMEEVERSFVGMERIAQRALELRTTVQGRLRVACLPALAHALLPQAMEHFQRLQPLIRVSVVPLESPWLEQALSEQRFDVGVSEALEAPAGVACVPLLEANEVAVLPANHALSRKRVLRATDFSQLPFISLAEGDPYREAIDQVFLQANVQRQLTLETASAVAVCGMVQKGLGLAIVNPLTAAAMEGPSLVVRKLEFVVPYRISVLLPQIAPAHPARESMHGALQRSLG